MSHVQEIAKVYDELADLFCEWTPSWKFRKIFNDTVLELVHQSSNSNINILDMGCGHGTWIKYVLDRINNSKNLVIEGIDISRERIRRAKYILKGYKNVSLKAENILKFTSEKKYDIIFFAEVFSLLDISTYEYVFHKCYELLNGPGYLVIIDKEKYSSHSLKTYVKTKLGLLHKAYAFTRWPSFRKLAKIGENCGLKTIKRKRVKEFRAIVFLKRFIWILIGDLKEFSLLRHFFLSHFLGCVLISGILREEKK